MTERAELIKRSTSGENAVKNYGAVSRHRDEDDEDDEVEGPTRCVCTRRDCILVTVLSILIATSIIASLSVGIPNIQRKQLQSTVVHLDKTSSVIDNPLNISRVSIQKRAAVSARNPLCADVGRSMLAKNASATDAAIVVLLCLEVVHPHHAGIGGGFLMTYHDRRQVVAIDAREMAPMNSDVNMSLPVKTGGLAVAIPMTLKGFWEIHQRYGRVPWRDLFTSSIELCLKGFKVDKVLAKALVKFEDYVLSSNLRELFINNSTGQLAKEGDLLTRPTLANTFQLIANKGIDVFYNGSLGQTLVADVQNAGGVLTMKDLHQGQVLIKKPLNVTLFNGKLKVLTTPPPGSGSLLIFLLNLFESFNNVNQSEVTIYQRLVESYKFAFGQRTIIGDDKFDNISDAVLNQTSKNFALLTSRLIRDNLTFPPDYYFPGVIPIPVKDGGTSHVSVVDSFGTTVSITSTINNNFGAKFCSPSLGIILNDEMNDFSASGLYNRIQPGKRPLSSMVPSIVVNETNDVLLVLGGAGGRQILTSVAHVLYRYLFLNETLPQSVDSLRLHHELIPNILKAEKGFPKDILQSLRSFGHNISNVSADSYVNAIGRRHDNESWLSVSDQ